jgi:hypothetical protein
MQKKQKLGFRSGFIPFFLLLILGAAAAVLIFVLYTMGDLRAFGRSSTSPVGGWAVEQTGSGLKISWNLDSPLFRNSRGAALQIRDGELDREFELDPNQKAGTLYYSPRTENCTLRLKIKGDPEKTEVIRIGSEAENNLPKTAPANTAPPVPVAPPMPVAPQKGYPSVSARTREQTSPAVGAAVTDELVPIRTMRARAPYRLTRKLGRNGLDVDVVVKIGWSGRVIEANTRKYDDPVEAELARVATNAALQWRFKPLGGSDTRKFVEQVLHFKFVKS